MPKPLEEYFPKKKSVKIMVRQHDRAAKLRKIRRKIGQLKLGKPKYCLRWVIQPKPCPSFFFTKIHLKYSVTQPNWEVSRKCCQSKNLIKIIIISVINFWLSCVPALQVEDSVVVHIKNHLTKSHLFFRYNII